MKGNDHVSTAIYVLATLSWLELDASTLKNRDGIRLSQIFIIYIFNYSAYIAVIV